MRRNSAAGSRPAEPDNAALVRQALELGAKTLMMTGNPERIVEFDGAGQPYLSKPFPSELFLQRVEEILAAEDAA